MRVDHLCFSWPRGFKYNIMADKIVAFIVCPSLAALAFSSLFMSSGIAIVVFSFMVSSPPLHE